MITYYARRAAEYEAIYAKPERQLDLARLKPIVERTFAGKNLLELACGTGYWTEVAARTATSILATDINEDVLTIARTKPQHRCRVTFRMEDAYATPEAAEQFDAGLAVFWWSHVPKQRIRHFLTSFLQRLGSGARVMFIDNVYVQGSNTPLCRTDGGGNSYQLRRLSDGSTHEVLKNFPTERELREAVADLASDLEVHWLQHYWLLTFTTSERSI